MNRLRLIAKLTAAQALGIFIVFNIVIWAICLSFTAYNLVVAMAGTSLGTLANVDRQSRLPNYANIPWASTHFAEFSSLKSNYVSYIGWRRPLFKGETINIVGDLAQRATVGTGAGGKPSVYFFGGSTMWGTGADDASTIPSLVTQLGGYRSENFGESGWLAHQSLVLLIQLLQEGRRPDVVVFYDGVNEVAHKCRREVGPTAHAREGRVKTALKATEAENVYGLQYMAQPLLALARVVADRVSVWTRDRGTHLASQFVCHTDASRAQRVAEGLIQDWDVARRLVESYGGKFVGILQPVVYYSDTKKDRLNLPDIEKQQYEAVYPLIKQRMAGHPDLHDLTGVLDHPEYIYIDFCHVSPNGNRYIAQKVVELLAAVKAKE